MDVVSEREYGNENYFIKFLEKNYSNVDVESFFSRCVLLMVVFKVVRKVLEGLRLNILSK